MVTLTQGGAVFVDDSTRVDVIGNAATVYAGSSDIVGVYGNGDTANVGGTGTGVWIGGSSDTVNLTHGGAVFVSNNSQVNINGDSTSVLAGTSDIIGLSGVGNAAIFSGGTTRLWLAGGATVTLGAAGEYVHTTVAQLANDTVSGLVAGNGIDISDLIPGSASFSFTANATGGVLHLADATHSTQFQLNGSYSPGSFHLAADGYGGTFLSYG